MPQLQELIIKASPFINIEFSELITSPTPKLSVDVDRVRTFKFSRNEYLALASGAKKGQIRIDGIILSMDCSCDNEATLWLMRAMAEDLVVAEDLLCNDDNKPLGNQTCDRLDCYRPACKLNTCVCCRVGTHEAVAAVCRNANLTTLPDEILRLRNLTQLIVANNRISSLPEKLPDTLLQLDLSDNEIQHLDKNETKVLFDVSTRKVRLAGNPILCNMESCYNQPLLGALQFPKNQVEDNVECIGEAKTLGSLPEFCELKFSTKREIILSFAVILIGILAAMALLTLYYRHSLKMYLFARGWCLWWLREDEMDEDRCYDVFLSFCHADEQVAVEQLLPELDRDYNVCIHTRDWVPGEMIPVQILRSVEQSRRTVIVVSSNYAKSLWGLLEFRTAYASGLSEGRSRVVMVVLDDVLESQDLNGELKQYIQLHTYVRWGDPWFWSKLRYALPHNPRQASRIQEPIVSEPSPQMLMLDVQPSQTEN
ncbi:TIR domain-containing protein [Phthorimaea operculella]|nr:TIR domain-containing protein [Phthorimaea operculella]